MILTVVVAAYNVSAYIKKCLDSIVDRLPEWAELIIVDDGSTDNTGAIARSYEGGGRVRYFYQKNAGLSGARNSGIEMARGDYLWFIDGDDCINPDAFLELKDSLMRGPAAIVFPSVDRRQAGDKIIYPKNSGEAPVAQYLSGRMRYTVWNKVLSRTIIKKLNLKFPVGRKMEDICFLANFFSGIDDGFVINLDCEPIYFYHIRDGSIITSGGIGNIVDSNVALSDLAVLVNKNYHPDTAAAYAVCCGLVAASRLREIRNWKNLNFSGVLKNEVNVLSMRALLILLSTRFGRMHFICIARIFKNRIILSLR